MKFSVKKENLESELQFLQGIAERKKTIPILSHILVEAENSQLKLSGTDLEVSLTTRCSASVEDAGGVTVSSKKLFEVVRSLPSGDVEMSSASGEWLEVRSGGAYFRLVSLPVNDFPEIPQFDFGSATEISQEIFREMIRRTLFAVTKEDVRYSLNGALLEIGDGVLRMVATDAHRLALVEVKDADAGTKESVRAIIPKKALSELRNLSGDEAMLFGQDEHHLHFKLGDRVLSTRVIEGQFPAYEKVLPSDNPSRVKASVEQLGGALRRVSLLASERSRAVKFTFNSGVLSVASSNPELGEAQESVPVEYEGDELTISFNAQYVLDFLGVVTGTDIELHLRDDTSQGMMVPIEDDASVDYRYVIMPMRL